MRFRKANGAIAVGAAIDGGDRLLDLTEATARRTGTAPSDSGDPMLQLIASGRSGLAEAYKTLEWSRREGDPAWFFQPDAVDWMTPVPARFCLAAGRNFPAHRQESPDARASNYHRGRFPPAS